MRSAFVSHSTSDDSFVAEMESFLRAAGFDEVFNDVSSIRPDERFWPAIEKGIADADTLVVVITTASTTSEWVKREVEFARDLSKKVIPIWVEDCPLPSTFADHDVIDFRPRTRAERRVDIDRIIVKYAPADLIGREDETKLLSDAWQKTLRLEKSRPHILAFVAVGGEGKTSLVANWAAELAAQDWPGCDAAFAWSFYSQGTREQVAASSDLFLKEALTFFGDDADKDFAASPAGAFEKGQRLARLVGQRRSLPHPRRPRAAAIRARLAHAGPAQRPGHRRAAQGPGCRQPRPVPRHDPLFASGPARVLADHRAGGEAAAPVPRRRRASAQNPRSSRQ